VKEDGFGGDIFGVSVEHDGQECGVALGLDGDGVGGAEKDFEELEDAKAMLGKDEKFGGGGFVFPRAGDGDRAVAGGRAVGEEKIRLSPAGACVEGIEHDLAVHFGAIELAQGSDLCKSGRFGGEGHGQWRLYSELRFAGI